MSIHPPLSAEVAVAAPIPSTLTYLVPADLAPFIQPGTRVLVPLGRRLVTGYVMALPDFPGESDQTRFANLKEIVRPLDDEPMFGPELLPLLRFAADYYHYPPGLVVAEALPTGLTAMTRRMIHITQAGRQALLAGNPDPDQAALLTRLERSPGLALARLLKEKNPISRTVRSLETAGWVTVADGFQADRVRSVARRWVSLPDIGPDDARPRSGIRVGPRAKELLARLAERGPCPVTDLQADFPSLDDMLRRLADRGLVKIDWRAFYRDDPGRALPCTDPIPQLLPEQARAVAALNAAIEGRSYAPFVLRGVTGSGKTEVYLAALEKTLAQGRTALMLVPEISLTPAFEGRLRARFHQEVAVLHSGLSAGERYDQWLRIRRGEVRVVLGARSAIFAPLEGLGLIVVDEEHDGAYKQEDKLKYQARDLAVYRAREARAVVVLGSATPSIESFQAARQGRYGLLTLTHRFGQGLLPRVDLIDLRLVVSRRRSALTPPLRQALADTLTQGRQALLFINRRGLAGLPLCLACGHVIKCRHCSVTMTLHQDEASTRENHHLDCHHCGYRIQPPQACPACGSPLLRYLGLGTQRLEKEVRTTFPEARVARLDADTARPKGELTRILTALREGQLDILIGTQMITKGHDFPNITLVGVIEADLGLHLPDFRAAERTFQLLAQVGGRAGRGEVEGRVVVQTHSPEHYTLLLAKQHDYLGFFHQELEQRLQAGYPPATRLALVRFEGDSDRETAESAAQAADLGRALLNDRPDSGVNLLGPAPAPLARVKEKYRWRILVRGTRVKPLHDFLGSWLDHVQTGLKGQGVTWMLDIDPYQML